MAGSSNVGTIPNINSPDVKVPDTTHFAFDPRGPGHFGAAIRDPLGLPAVARATLEAWKKTGERYPATGSHNNEADAYKHATWNYLMAQSLGKNRAKAFADAHEVSGRNSQGELLMDLYNNEVARNLPSGPDAVEEALRDGAFRTSPFRMADDAGGSKKSSRPGFPPSIRRW